jgi:hypothetical protein
VERLDVAAAAASPLALAAAPLKHAGSADATCVNKSDSPADGSTEFGVAAGRSLEAVYDRRVSAVQ